MSDKRHLVKVTIAGEDYSIRSDESPEHTRAVAEHVDRAIRDVLQSMQVVETQRAAIMAAMQITDELFRTRRVSEAVAGEMNALSDEVRRWLPPAKRVSGSESLESIPLSVERGSGRTGLQD